MAAVYLSIDITSIYPNAKKHYKHINIIWLENELTRNYPRIHCVANPASHSQYQVLRLTDNDTFRSGLKRAKNTHTKAMNTKNHTTNANVRMLEINSSM